MNVKQPQKLVVGIAIRTNNQECRETIPALTNKFYQEGIPAKIPHKVNDDILAIYTDYEGDFTKPYTYILGCEVSSFDQAPPGLVKKTIPASRYTVFESKGPFPESLGQAWQSIWTSNLARAYTTDFEVYPPDFHPQNNPAVKIYIATP